MKKNVKFPHRKHLKTLQRRLAHLRKRVAEDKRNIVLSYDLAEIDALKVAIDALILLKEQAEDPTTSEQLCKDIKRLGKPLEI